MTSNGAAERQYRPVSCAECRRQKLRCDRVFPCSSCRKRGCAAICPDGTKAATRAKKKMLSAENDIRILIERIRSLEEALSEAQGSKTPHPLLSQELREIAQSCANRTTNSVAKNTNHQRESQMTGTSDAGPPSDLGEDPVEQLTENLGTLSMTGYRRSKFFGTSVSAGGIFMFNKHSGTAGSPDSFALGIPLELMNISLAFLPSDNRSISQHILPWIETFLPPLSEAASLCETFFENAAYIFVPFWRSMFMDEIFSYFYQGNVHGNVEIPRGHRVAVLFMTLAMGEFFDLTKPAVPPGGKRYYYLARAALTTEATFSHPTLAAMQAIILMSYYISLSDEADAIEVVYILSGINVKLAFTLGLHREWSRFSWDDQKATGQLLRAREEELRRVIFHEVILFECWQTIRCGRPTMINPEEFDCGPPGLYPERNDIDETHNMESQTWSYGFLRNCIVPVTKMAVAVKPPKYSDILRMDKIVKGYSTPRYTRTPINLGTREPINRASVMEYFSISTMKEIVLLYLHKPYFALAMHKFSSDPLGCPLAPTVITSFTVAHEIIRTISQLFEKEPALSIRIWIFWDQLFAPCLVLALLVTNSPACKLSPRALEGVDQVVELLAKAQHGLRPAIFLPHARKLQEKAHEAYNHYLSTGGAHSTSKSPSIDSSDEFRLLLGHKMVGSQGDVDAGEPLASSSSPTSMTQLTSTDPPASLHHVQETESNSEFTHPLDEDHRSFLMGWSYSNSMSTLSAPTDNPPEKDAYWGSNIEIPGYPTIPSSDGGGNWNTALDVLLTQPMDISEFDVAETMQGGYMQGQPYTQISWEDIMRQIISA